MNTHTDDNLTLADKFNQIDYFTQRQIINEFPSVFPEHTKTLIDCTPIEHFTINKQAILDRVGFISLVLAALLLGYAHFTGQNLLLQFFSL